MAEPLRVLSLISELNFGGDENRLLTFARHAEPEVIEHTVVTVREIPDGSASLKPEFTHAGIPVLSLGSQEGFSLSGLRPWGVHRRWNLYRQLSRRLLNLLREHRIELISAHDQAAAFLARRAAGKAGIKTLQTLYHAGGWDTGWKRLPGKYVLRGAAGLVTDSKARAREIQEFAGSKCPPVSVIPNGVTPPLPVRTEREILDTLGWRERPKTVVAQLGRLVPFKGQSVLLEAAAQVMAEHPEVHLLLVGFEGPDGYAGKLRQRAAELGIGERVRVAAYRGSIGDVWSIVDVYAHASLFDSLPNAILEALSLGKPMAATTVGGIPEMVKDGESGLLVPPNDAGAMAHALKRILGDAALRTRLTASAIETYQARCTPQVMTTALQELMHRTARGES